MAFDGNYPIGASFRATEFSMPLIDYFEMPVGSYKNLFSLVIEIGTLNDVFEISHRVFSGTNISQRGRSVFSSSV